MFRSQPSLIKLALKLMKLGNIQVIESIQIGLLAKHKHVGNKFPQGKVFLTLTLFVSESSFLNTEVENIKN